MNLDQVLVVSLISGLAAAPWFWLCPPDTKKRTIARVVQFVAGGVAFATACVLWQGASRVPGDLYGTSTIHYGYAVAVGVLIVGHGLLADVDF